MCGIAGIVAPDVQAYAAALQRMVDALRHRGPDAAGLHSFQNCALGHARLSIVDLSCGAQPMLDETAHTAIVFNGEIYGYRDLRQALSSDYQFHTTSDTEVILALYAKYGSAMMSHLPGMFAFSIWDEQKQQLFCARDRFGEKPFYYAIGTNGEFIFASELKSLLASECIQPVLSRRSLAHYLRRGYIYPTRTIYENVHTLPPAHSLLYADGKVHIEKYWHLPTQRPQFSLSEASEEFREHLDRAVGNQLIADVEVGAFLSGGLDSSTLVALAARKLPKLKTYSFGFSKGLSELPYAKAVADQYGTEHVELREEGHDIGTLLCQMQEVYDEPFYDSAMIPTYLICKLARQYGKVVLAGEGADELLGGYQWWYLRSMRMEQEKNTSSSMLPLLYTTAIWEQLLQRVHPTPNGAARKWRDRLRAVRDWKLFGSIVKEHQAQTSFVTDEELSQLGLGQYPDESIVTSRDWEPSDTINDALWLDVEDYMAGDILVKTDRAAMAHGLELRSPFLDVDFASFCLSLPPEFKVTRQSDKLILREAFAGDWPEAIRTRHKQGFGASLDNWVAEPSVQELKHEYLDNPGRKVFQILPFEGVQRFMAGNARKIWLLLVLALWAETHSFDL